MSRIARKFIRFGLGVNDVNAQVIPANAGTPTYYTPTQVGSEGTDKISAHLKGIDTSIGAASAASLHLNGDNMMAGSILFNPDNTYNIGANAANRPKSLFVSQTGLFGTSSALFEFTGHISVGSNADAVAFMGTGSFPTTDCKIGFRDVTADKAYFLGYEHATPNFLTLTKNIWSTGVETQLLKFNNPSGATLNLLWSTDALGEIGAIAGNRPNNIYAYTNITASDSNGTKGAMLQSASGAFNNSPGASIGAVIAGDLTQVADGKCSVYIGAEAETAVELGFTKGYGGTDSVIYFLRYDANNKLQLRSYSSGGGGSPANHEDNMVVFDNGSGTDGTFNFLWGTDGLGDLGTANNGANFFRPYNIYAANGIGIGGGVTNSALSLNAPTVGAKFQQTNNNLSFVNDRGAIGGKQAVACNSVAPVGESLTLVAALPGTAGNALTCVIIDDGNFPEYINVTGPMSFEVHVDGPGNSSQSTYDSVFATILADATASAMIDPNSSGTGNNGTAVAEDQTISPTNGAVYSQLGVDAQPHSISALFDIYGGRKVSSPLITGNLVTVPSSPTNQINYGNSMGFFQTTTGGGKNAYGRTSLDGSGNRFCFVDYADSSAQIEIAEDSGQFGALMRILRIGYEGLSFHNNYDANSLANPHHYNIMWEGDGVGGNIGLDSGGGFARPIQVQVKSKLGVGLVAAQNASAKLQVDSTTQGVLPPRMTQAQRDAISSPASGLIVYNTNTNALNIYNGTMWSAVGGTVWTKYTLSHTAFQTAALVSTIELFNAPTNTVISGIIMKHSTAFAGTGITAYTLGIGLIGNTNLYSNDFDVKQTVSATAYQSTTEQQITGFSGSTSVKITALSTGANLDQSSAGSVDVWVQTSVLP